MTTVEVLQNSARSEAVGPLFVDTFPDYASWDECQRAVEADERRTRRRIERAEAEFALRDQ